MRDTTAQGRPFRIWTLVDDCTRECPLLVVDRGLPARRVVEALETVLPVRDRPRAIVCDNGPEFTSLELDQWAAAHDHFATSVEARTVIEAWRQEYNTERPHRGLGQQTPAEYAASFTPEEGHFSTRHSDAAVA